jgi:predicted tellurium resistance membrane protein TerC
LAACPEASEPAALQRRGAIAWSIGWVLLAAAAALGIALLGGPTSQWTTAYLIERSHSLDNVFLFSLLLAYFLVPAELRGRVILIGIVGALVLRGVAILGGLAVIEIADFLHIGDLASLAVIGAFLAGGILASLAADRLDPPHSVEQASRRPPRCPERLTP